MLNRNTVFVISQGDIFKEKTQVKVCPVNCYGVMGKGLALQFKHKYPDMYLKYKAACTERKIFVGQVFEWKIENSKYPEYIICFPTKIHWQNPSEYKYIEFGLKSLKSFINARNINSIAIPAIGCGLGNLDFDVVIEMIQRELYLSKDLRIYIYPPKDNSWKKLNA